MTRARRLIGTTAGLALAAGLGALSRAPIRGAEADEAALRLSWRLRGEEAGECRPPSSEDLEALPPHMRNPGACVVTIAPYRLTVDVDGRSVVDAPVEASGARGDRPLFVFQDIRLPAGRHAVRIRFEPERTETEREATRAVPPAAPPAAGADVLRLQLDTVVRFGSGEVRLVTRAAESGALVLRRPRG